MPHWKSRETTTADSGEGASCSRYVGVGIHRSVVHGIPVTSPATRIVMISEVGADPVSLLPFVLLVPAPPHVAFAWWIPLAYVLYPYGVELPKLKFQAAGEAALYSGGITM